MTERVSLPLQYAVKPKRRMRTWVRFAMALIVLSSSVAFWKWREPIERRAKLLYWQHRCMTSCPAASIVVYAENEDEQRRLLRSGPHYRQASDLKYSWLEPTEWMKVPYGGWSP